MGKQKKAKPNPRSVPKTQQDVDRAYLEGLKDGVDNANVIFLSVLMDQFNAGDHLKDVWHEIGELSKSVKEHRVSIADLRTALKEESGIIA